MGGPEIRVLGQLRLTLDGRETPLGTPMQRAVLGRLIVARGQAVAAERLVDDLWAGAPPPKATSVLQVHVHNLRRLLEPDRPRRAPSRYLVSESSGYALRIAENAVDAWQFEEQLRTYQELTGNPETRPQPGERSALLETVLGQWHGPALEAFADTEWATAEADRLTDLWLTAVELNAQAKLEVGRSGEVVIELRALFDEHPGREELVRMLATAQYQLGQQLEALTTIRRSREFLSAEFGVDPGPGLRHLETAILTHSTELAVPGGLPAVTESPAPAEHFTETPAGTGYSAELSDLLTLAEVARTGRLRLAWISGEAGMGKTALSETVLAALTATGWTVATGNCLDIDGAPAAWPWTEIYGNLEPTAAVAFPSGGEPDPFTLSRKLAQACRRAAVSAPVAILLEDVHRADTATLQVLRQLINWLRDEPVLILATTRRSEAGRGVRDTAAALAQYAATHLELTGLDAAGTRQVAEAAGLTPIGSELLAQLHERTGGNPLFVRELAKLLAAHGTLEQVPESIRELIDNRTARLPNGVAEVLQYISIWGSGVELGILRLATGLPEEGLIDLIAAAEAAGLVRSAGGGRIRFEHDLVRDAVQLGIPPLRRSRMHWAALELLRENADSYPVLARDPDILARHAIRGASAETARAAITYVRTAAERRMARRDRNASVRLLRAAVELHDLAGDTADHAEHDDRIALLDTRCALVTALGYDNQHRAARAERLRALALAEDLDNERLRTRSRTAAAIFDDFRFRTRALTCWRAPVIWAIREWRTPDHRIRRALSRALAAYDPSGPPTPSTPLGPSTLPGRPTPLGPLEPLAPPDVFAPPPLPGRAAPAGASGSNPTESASPRSEMDEASDAARIRLLVAASFEAGLEEYDDEQAMARQALGLARTHGDAESLCAAINAVTYLTFDFGPEFVALTAELERVAAQAGLAEYQALAHFMAYRAAVAHGDLREAARRVAQAVEYADEGQLQPLLDLVSCFAATMELLRGEVEPAERLYEQFGRRITRSGIANAAEAKLFCALGTGWARGDLAVLAARLGEIYTLLPGPFGQAYALALIHAGEHGRAREIYDETAGVREEMYPVLMSALRARTAIALGESDDIRTLYEYLLPHSGSIIGSETGMTAFGPLDTVLAALADALGDTDVAAAHRESARRQLERIRTELPIAGNSLLRAA
ncbi:AAA family ATPase [Nocardia sp. NBC_01503]|uniref:BTAD domain-containing putative transcriptional regulator n=1 Tax=Nocardia sp. NBC_01503 TaxID=2975997 RepID=UPI002E7BF411|nr:BTAD domain-containing putative transcriptional regulator [Nocardia sp. NBC_01503]WTL33553.1 AAA family ATPase [Nocardia sp. NBC_01503]